MNEIKTFESTEFGKVRTMTIEGEPWFVGKDVASILGYTNPSKALTDHVGDEDKLNNESLSSLGQRGGWLINESGLYSLILSSKLPSAKKFKKWVTSEVLPIIRKTGGYVSNSDMFVETYFSEVTDDMKVVLKELLNNTQKLKEQNKILTDTVEIQNQQIAELSPKATYYDQILKSKTAVPITYIAKDYGLTACELNKILHKHKVQYKMGQTWLLYAEHANCGYTKSQTFITESGNVSMRTYWTQAGRLFINDLLKTKENILPLMER